MDIFKAIRENDIEYVKQYIEEGGDVNNSRGRMGQSILYIACLYKNYDIAKLLLQQPEIDVNAGNSFAYVCYYNLHELIELFIHNPNLDVNKQNEFSRETIFYELCKDSREIKNYSDDDNFILPEELKNDHIETIKLLLSHPKIDINYRDMRRGWSILYMLCYFNDIEIVKLFLNHPRIDVNITNLNDEGDFPLFIACEKNRKEIIELLVSHPQIDVNKRDSRGYTVLHSVCLNNNLDILKILLKNSKVNVNSINTYRETPLHFAFSSHSANCYKELLKHPKINVNAIDGQEESILSTAILRQDTEGIKLLIDHPNLDITFNIIRYKKYVKIYSLLKNRRNEKLSKVNEILNEIQD